MFEGNGGLVTFYVRELMAMSSRICPKTRDNCIIIGKAQLTSLVGLTICVQVLFH